LLPFGPRRGAIAAAAYARAPGDIFAAQQFNFLGINLQMLMDGRCALPPNWQDPMQRLPYHL